MAKCGTFQEDSGRQWSDRETSAQRLRMTSDDSGGFGRKYPEKIRRPPRGRRTGQVEVGDLGRERGGGVRDKWRQVTSGELLYPVELRAQTDESGEMLESPRAALKRRATHIAFPAFVRKQMSASHAAPDAERLRVALEESRRVCRRVVDDARSQVELGNVLSGEVALRVEGKSRTTIPRRLVAGASIERVRSARGVRRYASKSYMDKEFVMPPRARGWDHVGNSSGMADAAEMLEASKLVAGRLIPQSREIPPVSSGRGCSIGRKPANASQSTFPPHWNLNRFEFGFRPIRRSRQAERRSGGVDRRPCSPRTRGLRGSRAPSPKCSH